MSGTQRLRDRMQFLAGRLILMGLLLVPRQTGLAIGRLMGWVFYHLSSRHRRVALDNLLMAFGSTLPAESRERIARESFAHLGMLCVDSAYFSRLLRLPVDRVALYEGVEHLQSAASIGRGVLVFSGHFGHWELIALLQPRLGVPMTMVAKALRSAPFDEFLNRIRSLSGNAVLPARHAVRSVLRSLRGGQAVALLIDQNVRGEGGIFVDFFGVPASTTPALAILAFKSGAPIVPVFSYLDPGGRLRVRYGEQILPERKGRLKDDIELLTQRCTRILEDEIRRRPGHWLWMHNRWRTRPESQGRRSCGKAGGVTQVPERVAEAGTKEVSSP